MSLAWIIYTCTFCFFAFYCRKTRLHLPAKRLSGLCIQCCAFLDAVSMKGLWIKCVFATRFLVYHKETKGLETFFRLILSEKDYSSRKHYTNFPLVTLKCCCFPRKLGKQIKFVTFFCLHDRRNSRHFSNLEPKLAHAYNVFPLQKKINKFRHSTSDLFCRVEPRPVGPCKCSCAKLWRHLKFIYLKPVIK